MAVTIYTDTVPTLGQDPTTFSNANQSYVNYVTGNLVPEINQTATDINTSETNAETSASNSATSATQSSASATEANEAKSICLTSANIVGAWVDASGAATAGGAYFHNGGWWGLLNDVGNISATEPSDVNTDWGFINQGVQAVRVPIPVAPLNGSTGVSTTPSLEAEPYGNAFGTARDYREFQVDIDTGDFSSPVYAPTPADEDTHAVATPLNLSSGYKWRCRDVSTLGEVSGWMPVQSFSTGAVIIVTPTITVEGSPSDVPESPTLTASPFTVQNGSDTHLNTDWEVLRQSDAQVIWSSPADAVNLTSITVPSGILQENTTYIFRVRYRGTTYGESGYGSDTATTLNEFFKNSIVLLGRTATDSLIYEQDGDTLLNNGVSYDIPPTVTSSFNGTTNNPEGDCAYTEDGQYLALVGSTGMEFYKYVNEVYTKLSTPVISTGLISCAWNPAGTHLIIGRSSGEPIVVSRSGDILAIEANLPHTFGSEWQSQISWSGDGSNLFIASSLSPQLFSFNGSSFTRNTQFDGLSKLTNGGGGSINYNGDLISWSTSGSCEIFKLTTGTWALIDTVTSSLYLGRTTWSKDSTYLAVTKYFSSNGINVFKYDGVSSFSDITTNVSDNTIGFRHNIAFDETGTYLYSVSASSPYIYMHKRSGDNFTKITNPSVIPTGPVDGLGVFGIGGI